MLKKKGLKYGLPKIIPNASEVKEQKKFIQEYEEIRQFSDVEVLFIDGMHLVHQIHPARCWIDPKNPPIFTSNTGRHRLNIFGALNIDNLDFLHLTNEENCDANKSVIFFEQILKKYPNAHSIVLILDNAPYFRSKKVQKWLDKNPKLICFFLPSYSPNLNLIERFWRFAKKQLVNNLYYAHYKTFRCHVFCFLNRIHQYHKELKLLITEKFQIIQKKTRINKPKPQ